MTALTSRIRSFLVRHPDEWISARRLGTLARKAGFPYEHVRAAFDELETLVDVGLWSIGLGDTKATLPPGRYYKWYALSDEKKAERRAQLAYFDEM